MRIYIASRYGRRLEMLGYAAELEAAGHVVTSRWITGCHEIPGKREGNGETPYTTEERAHFAVEDLADLYAADCIISFTEPEDAAANRGGRHVEHGVAWMLGHSLFVVGPRENIFHCLMSVHHFETWNLAKIHAELDAVSVR